MKPILQVFSTLLFGAGVNTTAQEVQLISIAANAAPGTVNTVSMNRYGHVAGNSASGAVFWSTTSGVVLLSARSAIIGNINDRDEIAATFNTRLPAPLTYRAVVLHPKRSERDLATELALDP